MSFSKYPLALAIAGALPFTALAQSSDADDLDEVVVTATRTAITTDASLAPVEVIDRDAIARSQAGSLGELLRGRAGINLSNQGGAGKLSALFMRGSESDHVLVLVDGVRIGSATSGLASFQDLPVALIDRIEIVRGPRSSLYGSDAIGGVIQIFTRRDSGKASFHFQIGAGSHGRREGALGVGGNTEHGWFGIDTAFQTTDGINACNGFADDTNFIYAGCFVNGQTDRDGYENHSFSARGGIDIGESVTLEAHALHVSGHNDYDGSFVDNSDIVQQAVGAQLRWKTSDRVDLRFNVGSIGSLPNGDFASRRDSASAQADIALAEAHLLTLGVDWLRDRIDSDTDYDNTRRGNRAAFAQYQGRLATSAFGTHDVQLALRRDDNDQFGGETTGTAAWGLNFADAWRVTASYGTAFKAPTFNELYYPFFSNPALRPESSKTYEIGLAWHGETTRVRLDAFNTDVKDLIAFNFTTFLPDNIQDARLRGAELRVDSKVLGWDVGASAGWLDPQDRASGNDLPRRARGTARLELDRGFGKFRLGFTGIAEGARYDDLANTREMGGFATLDVRGEYAFAADWTLQARVANAFDKHYETAAFYNQPGREWSLTVRYRPTP
jgi:vitamin B12 transporter